MSATSPVQKEVRTSSVWPRPQQCVLWLMSVLPEVASSLWCVCRWQVLQTVAQGSWAGGTPGTTSHLAAGPVWGWRAPVPGGWRAWDLHG